MQTKTQNEIGKAVKLTDEEWASKLDKLDSTSVRAVFISLLRALRASSERNKTIPADHLLRYCYDAVTHAQMSAENSVYEATAEKLESISETDKKLVNDLKSKKEAMMSPDIKIIQPSHTILKTN